MGVKKTVLLFLGLVALSAAWPRKGRSENSLQSSFIGRATNELATAILQSYVDDDSNLAFSPLGYSVILAILNEGAKGETKSQLTTALKLPADEKVVRSMYQGIMKRLHNTHEYKLNSPEFKNWFYVYKNYTINDEYKKILEEYYLTEVKSVEKYDSSFIHDVKDADKKKEEDTKVEDAKVEDAKVEEIKVEDAKVEETKVEDTKVEETKVEPSVDVKEPGVKDLITKDNSKDINNFDKLQKDDDKKKVAVPVAGPVADDVVKVEGEKKKDEVVPEKKSTLEVDEKIISFAMEDKPEKTESELYDKHDLHKPGKNIKEKIKLANTFPKAHQDGADYEIMEAVEARNHARTTKNLFSNDDVTSSLSANRVVSRDSKDPNSIMILFNGLYFRGSWKTPFKNIPSETFYTSPTVKKSIPMMKTIGTFKSGSLAGLDSVAVEIPYFGDRYSLLLVVPRARDGLRRLSAELVGHSSLVSSLEKKKLQVRMPPFYVEVTTKPLAALAKFGVSSIFNPDADLSGISPVEGLFVQEMVQHVSVKVDNGGSAQAQLTAANPSSLFLERSQPLKDFAEEDDEESIEEFVVNSPFLFFVRDVVDDVVVVAGKVTDPEYPDSQLE